MIYNLSSPYFIETVSLMTLHKIFTEKFNIFKAKQQTERKRLFIYFTGGRHFFLILLIFIAYCSMQRTNKRAN